MNKIISFATGLFLILCIFSSCEDSPTVSERGQFRVSHDEGYILTSGGNNLLTLTADYPILKVSSIFSLTTQAPEIAYIGQFHDIVEIPSQTDAVFSTQATIHNLGGYLIKMRLSKPGTSSTETCIVKILIKEGPFSVDEYPDYLDFEYEIYR